MKVKKQIICDICGNPIICRRNVGYKIKKKQYFLDATYHRMDVCGDCMWKIIKAIREEKEV